MAIAGGNITAWLGFAGLADSAFVPPAADYPIEDKVAYSVVYANGTMIGNRTEPTIGVVLDGERYGARGIEFEGVYTCPAGGSEEEEAPVVPVYTGTPGFMSLMHLLGILPYEVVPEPQPGLSVGRRRLVYGSTRALGSGRVVGRSRV
jgi:hypothetical protein